VGEYAADVLNEKILTSPKLRERRGALLEGK